MRFLFLIFVLTLTSCFMKTKRESVPYHIPTRFLGKWREVDELKNKESLLFLDISSKAAVLTMKSQPGTSQTFSFQKVLESSEKELKIKCSIPDVTLELDLKGDLLYKYQIFPSGGRLYIPEIYERY